MNYDRTYKQMKEKRESLSWAFWLSVIVVAICILLSCLASPRVGAFEKTEIQKWGSNCLKVFDAYKCPVSKVMPETYKGTLGGDKSFSGEVLRDRIEASYYHDKFEGRLTANQEIFQQDKLTCAVPPHMRNLLGTNITVSYQGKTIIVHCNDICPMGRLDLSKKAFSQLENLSVGLIQANIN